MNQQLIGVAVPSDTVQGALAMIERAEQLGIPAAWMTTGMARPDNLTTFAAAAVRTQRITLGTSIVPTFPRHPLVTVQQTQAIAQLLDVPVMASALQRDSFELCGEEADGAISWVCPGPYLRDVALPAMRVGAERAGRPVPPLIAHAPVCVHDNGAEVYLAVREQIMNPRLPFYQHMFIAAGFPEAKKGTWSDRMIDATVLWGNEARVTERLQELLAWGATEILV